MVKPSSKCVICGNSDMRRLIELGWNANMRVPDLAHGFGGIPAHAVIYKHLKEHAEGAWSRQIEVEDARPLRERVMAIQRAQIEAIERQMFIAQQKADDYTALMQGHPDFDPQMADPAAYFNILAKDMQAAIQSIQRTQGLTDKHEAAKATVAVDMYKLMGGTPPPSHLIGDGSLEVEGEATEAD